MRGDHQTRVVEPVYYLRVGQLLAGTYPNGWEARGVLIEGIGKGVSDRLTTDTIMKL
jgi:hypothetical protein